MMSSRKCAFAVSLLPVWVSVCFALLVVSAPAEPWGNDGFHNMVQDAKNLPIHFNEETEVWSVKTGTRHQFPQPTIVGDKVLVGSDAGGNPGMWREAVRHGAGFTSYNMKDGSMDWRLIVPQGGYGPGSYGVCGTPVIRGDRVYILAMWDMYCLDLDGLADGNDGAQNELELMMRRPFKLPEGEERLSELPEWAADVIWHFDLGQYDIKVQDALSCSVVEVDGQVWVSTSNEVGNEARIYKPDEIKPHMVVLDSETGKLIARDAMNVPIVFHGEWSSPSLIEVKGKKAVIFPDGYGVLHCFAIPEAAEDGTEVILKEYWTLDLNPKGYRYLDDGREIVYTLDKRIAYKYPKDYYTNNEKYYMWGAKPAGEDAPGYKKAQGFSNKNIADGGHETIIGPCEVISMPAVKGNRIYVGIGRDGAYGLGRATGRFVCIEVEDVEKEPKILWEDREIGRTQCTASIHDGLVYVADGHGQLNCYDAETGEVVYRLDLDSKGIKERSQYVVDEKIYICTDKKMMKVFKTGRTPSLLAESRLREECATIDAMDGKIVVVTPREVYLYASKNEGDAETALEEQE